MPDLDFDLKTKADQDYEALKARKRRNYRLARDMGFTAREAKVLSGYSQTRIIQIAQSRTNGSR